MSDVFQLLSNPVMLKAVLKLLGCYVVFMAFASALPIPEQTDGKFYRFVFHFFNALSVNVFRVAHALKVPGAEQDQPKP